MIDIKHKILSKITTSYLKYLRLKNFFCSNWLKKKIIHKGFIKEELNNFVILHRFLLNIFSC
jgi:hypothetical protein